VLKSLATHVVCVFNRGHHSHVTSQTAFRMKIATCQVLEQAWYLATLGLSVQLRQGSRNTWATLWGLQTDTAKARKGPGQAKFVAWANTCGRKQSVQ